MRQCKNCVWQGEEHQTRNSLKHCPVCGDWTNEIPEEIKILSEVPLQKPILVKIEESKKEEVLDLNKDGKVDIQDQKQASSMLSSIKSKLKRGKK